VEVGELLRTGAEPSSPEDERDCGPRHQKASHEFAAVDNEREAVAGCSLGRTPPGALAT